MNCHQCAQPLDHVIATVTFSGFEKARLNGTSLRVHARCLPALFAHEEERPLPPRIPEPAADTEQVYIYLSDGEWLAHCRECGRDVAQKPEIDDAHLAAARHIGRVHSGLVPA